MTTKHTGVLIIGAGLCGLTLAYYLKQLDLKITIIEARDRVGGRIHTVYNTNQAPIELGATWLIKEQTATLSLLKELNLDVFEQHYSNTAIYHPNYNEAAQHVQLPTNDSASYRINNGSQSIIKALLNTLSNDTIKLNQNLQSIKLTKTGLIAKTGDCSYQASHIISTLPPSLLLKHIKTKPPLPKILQEVMLETHTWMHNAIRIGFTYKKAFWKSDKTSGTIYSNTGPLQEFYDHSNAENTRHALSGFMNGSYSNISKEERKTLALQQLQRYYGDQALAFERYEECVWNNERFTTAQNNSFLMPQKHNGHAVYQKPYLENKLFIAGTETSPIFSGKMEGAITSAQFVYNTLRAIYKAQ